MTQTQNPLVRDIRKFAKQHGVKISVVDEPGVKHLKIVHEGVVISTMSRTPSDCRSLRNVKAQIAGVVRERNSADVHTEAASTADVRPSARQRKRHGG
jgi:hypothetical protein